MKDVIFIGNRRDACLFRDAGIDSFCPEDHRLVERVIAERHRCRVPAMTAKTFAALPGALARELREGAHPHLSIVTAPLHARAHAHRVPRELKALATSAAVALGA